MVKIELHYVYAGIFNRCNTNSSALLVGEIPRGGSSFAIGKRLNDAGRSSQLVTVVPFLPHDCYVNNQDYNEEGRARIINWVSSGGIEKVVGFKSRRDLTSALKNGDNISIYISPIQSSKVLEYSQIIIPAECVRGIILRG